MTNYSLLFNERSGTALARAVFCLLFSSSGLGPCLGQTPPARAPAETPSILLPQKFPRPESPIDYFRKLLEMDSAAQSEALAGTSPEKRKYLEAKLREYRALPAEEREGRLRVTELRYYLLPLMQTPPNERAQRFDSVPPAHSALIQERLDQWDRLPSDLQREVLENERAMHYFMRLENRTPSEREEILGQMPATSRRALEDKLEQWRALPAEQRHRMYEQFHRFFEMPADQKEKALHGLSEEERQKVEKAIASFGNLTPDQRKRCIDSFRKMANMSKEDRQQFLRNAQRWETMSPRERDAWRNLVKALPPPPPGLLPQPVSSGLTTQKAPSGASNPPPPLPGAGRFK